MPTVYLPHGASGSESHGSMIEATPFSHFVMDRPIVELWQPLHGFLITGPDNIESMGAGATELGEVTTSEIGGLLFENNNDSHSILWRLPLDIDLGQAIDFRVLWSNSAAAATGSCQFVVTYLALTAGTTALSAPATALDTVIVDQADLAADIPQWTAWGSIAAAKTGVATLTPGNDFLVVKVASTLTTITDASGLALQARFYRKYVA